MKRFSILPLIMAALLLLTVVDCSREESTRFYIATGSTGGTYYPVGTALAQIVSLHIPGMRAEAQTGNASKANCDLIRTHEIESALTQNNVAYWAYTGTEFFEQQGRVENLRGIASLYPEVIQIVTRKSENINSISDLKGKRVVVGASGSGTEIDARKILDAHGITYDDIEENFLDFSGAIQRLRDGLADAAFQTAGYPTLSITDLAATEDIVLVPIEDDTISKLIAKNRYYTKAVIPAGTYGIDADVPTVGLMAIWAVDASQPTERIYQITKALWEHRSELEKVHEKCKEITLETALDGIGIPVHPGAEKYYREKAHPGI